MDRFIFSQHSKLHVSALAVALSALLAPIGVAATLADPSVVASTSTLSSQSVQTNSAAKSSSAAKSISAAQSALSAKLSPSATESTSQAMLAQASLVKSSGGIPHSSDDFASALDNSAFPDHEFAGNGVKVSGLEASALENARHASHASQAGEASQALSETRAARAASEESEARNRGESLGSDQGQVLAANLTHPGKVEVAELKDRALSEIMQKVWPNRETENTDTLAYQSHAQDPFAKEQSSWIEYLLGGAIAKAQAEGDGPSFNYFSSVIATSAQEISSGVPLRQLWAPTQFRLKSGALLENNDFKRDYMQTLDRGFSYISYLFHQNNPFRSRYNIPVVFLNESGASRLWLAHNAFSPFKLKLNEDQVWGNYPTLILDRRYTSGSCQGLGVLEADLLGKCQAENREDMRLGVIVVPSMSGFVVNEGIYTGVIRHIAPNVMQVNILASGIAFAARLAGVASNVIIPQHKGGVASFPDHLGNFERHLYSTTQQGFVRPGQKFTDIAHDCRLTNQKACALYFVGEDVQRILGKHAGPAFSLGTSLSLPQLSAEELASYKVALDRYGSGLYTISSIDLAQIRKAKLLREREIAEEEEIEDEDAAAIESLKSTSGKDLAVEVEPASLETSETVAAAAHAATGSINEMASDDYATKSTAQAKAIPNAQVSDSEAEDELTGDPNLALIEADDTPDAESTAASSQTQDSASAQVSAPASAQATQTGQAQSSAQVVQAESGAQALAQEQSATAVFPDQADVSLLESSAASSATENTVRSGVRANVAQFLAENARTKSVAQQQAQQAKAQQNKAQPEQAQAQNMMVSPDKLKTNVDIEVQSGIPVYFNELGQPVLGLRNTLLSYGDYKNYNFLTEVEMMMLSDLGYSIESAEFYGNSVYSQGSTEQRLLHHITQGFGLYDHKNKTYNLKQPATVPSAVGLHVYGDYNDLVQSSNFKLAGVGSIGVRIDGCDNYYYQQSDSVIESDGVEGSGLAFTYGKNNSAYIGGKITAVGSKGVAIRADMGSNINSDLVEYRGSYIRARSLDYQEGRLSLQEATAVPLLDELKGPQVKAMTITGQIEGSRAAIFIDESSLVRDINVASKAKITGGIYSTWNPSVDGSGNIRVKHDLRRNHLVDAFIQYPERDSSETKRELAIRELTTHLNLGVQLDAEKQVIFADGEDNGFYDETLEGDPKSRVVLNGSVNGGSIRVKQFGGKSTINGDVRAYSIDVFEGVLKVAATQDSSINQLNKLKIMPYGVLDLVDGKGSQTYVQEEASFGRNATVRVDVDADGNILDELNYMGVLLADDFQIRIEPAVRYDTLKSLASNPKTMLTFITNFMQKANERFASNSISLRFPRYIWDSAGSYGRELKCSARGCRIGGFVSNEVVSKFDNVQPWRYYLSFSGLLLFFVAFYAAYFIKRVKAKV